jgi:hypothetical protein
MPDELKILFISDIVGKPGRKIFSFLLPKLIQKYKSDLIIANIENIAGGFGITVKTYKELENLADIFTSGNHIWDKKETLKNIDEMQKLIRPLNVHPSLPGEGYKIIKLKNIRVLVINLLGRVFMKPVDDPFQTIDSLLKTIQAEVKIVDFHAEATSEKEAMGWYLNGRVTAMIGTHTHVQTADERILNKDTAYITDVGMTGSLNGIIGFKKEEVIEKIVYGIPKRLETCKTNLHLNGVFIKCNLKGKAHFIERIDETMED